MVVSLAEGSEYFLTSRDTVNYRTWSGVPSITIETGLSFMALSELSESALAPAGGGQVKIVIGRA